MTTTFYSHWRDLPESTWRWPNFNPAEIACRGTGKLLVNEPALDKLQALRDRLGKPLIVRSAYRSPELAQNIPANSGLIHRRVFQSCGSYWPDICCIAVAQSSMCQRFTS